MIFIASILFVNQEPTAWKPPFKASDEDKEETWRALAASKLGWMLLAARLELDICAF